MTEISSLLTTTYPLQNSYPVTALPVSVPPLQNGTVSPTPVEEEEYTIKCICGYNDDDGNTVYCEKCDTWQHIDCYYHGEKVPEIHYCTECAPAGTTFTINADKARERQRRSRDILDGGGDRKVKRPTAKGQKKKRDTISNANANADQANGFNNHDRHDSLTNGKDQPPPAKKAKTSHRPSASVASINGDSRKRAYSNLQSYPSPSKSPQDFQRFPVIPYYTEEFAYLYDRDKGDVSLANNEQTIQGSLVLTKFRNDPSMVAPSLDSPLADKARCVQIDHDVSTGNFPAMLPLTKTSHSFGKSVDEKGDQCIWRLLQLQQDVTKNTIVGEIKGQITTLEEYCQQVTGPNRWTELSHPDPFVFFHPHMDICIDSRRAGTIYRYIRRSCDPNLTIKTLITPDDELHHCFVARHDIKEGEELTISWYIPPQFHANGTDMAARDDKGQLSAEWCEYVSRLLANFGDCACNSPKCKMSSADRRGPQRAFDPSRNPDPQKQPGSRKRKAKPKPVSPAGTGRAANSRAGSEAVRGHNDDGRDRKSMSASSGRRSRSRDLTPQTGALLDQPSELGAIVTERELKKIRALTEKEKEISVSERRKKRAAAAAASKVGTPSKDSRKDSGSPLHAAPMPIKSSSTDRSAPAKPATPRQDARSCTTTGCVVTPDDLPPKPFQPVDLDPPPQPIRWRGRRIYCEAERMRLRIIQWRKEQVQRSNASTPDAQAGQIVHNDTQTHDASTSASNSPATTKASPLMDSPSTDISSTPLPSQAAHSHPVHGLFKVPALKPTLSTLPPVPPFPASTSSEPAKSATSSPASSVPAIVQPSPVKKKLSLGDYMSRRKESATPTSEKPVINFPESGEKADSEALHRSSDATPSDVPMLDATQAKAPDNEQAVEDSPMPDADEKAAPSGPSAEVQSVLSSLQTMQSKQQESA